MAIAMANMVAVAVVVAVRAATLIVVSVMGGHGGNNTCGSHKAYGKNRCCASLLPTSTSSGRGLPLEKKRWRHNADTGK